MQNFNMQNPAVERSGLMSQIDIRPLMRLVYMWMGLGLLVTAVVSFVVSSNVELALSLAQGWFVLMIVQLGIVFGLSFLVNRIKPAIALILFFVYAASMGLTLGVMFLGIMIDPEASMRAGEIVYSNGGMMTIASAAATTAGLFGVMTVIGYTTKVDLSRFSTYFMMALIGLVIAMLVNMFLQNDTFSLIISVFGVLLFTGLTAWDTQKIKQMAMMPEMQHHSDSMMRLSIMGALTLYLDFINLFIFLLSIFSSRD